MEVLDAHIHVTKRASINYPWMAGLDLDREWEIADLEAAAAGSADKFAVSRAVFVEVDVEKGMEVDEAMFAISLTQPANPPHKINIVGVVAQIPANLGAAAVVEFLNAIASLTAAHTYPCRPISVNGQTLSLPTVLRGGRIILHPESVPDNAIAHPLFLEGLAVLAAAGLHWETTVRPSGLPHLTAVATRIPSLTLVLDHASNGPEPGKEVNWESGMRALAKHRNVYVKIGGLDAWAVQGWAGQVRGVRCILEWFGYDRCIAESNWFVCGKEYSRGFEVALEALEELGATAEQRRMVFVENAERIYLS